MKSRRLLAISAIACGLFWGSSPSHAGPILTDFFAAQPGAFDFRNGSVYGGCDNVFACTVSEPGANGRQITVEALGGGKLYRDNADGFGIRGGENDEVSGTETLRLTIDGGWLLVGWAFTDLFPTPDGGSDGETARIEGFAGTPGAATSVFALNHDALVPGDSNGELAISGQSFVIDFLEFTVPTAAQGNPGGSSGEEFSVAGLGGQAIPAPEPAGLAIFGAGLVGFATFTRRRRG